MKKFIFILIIFWISTHALTAQQYNSNIADSLRMQWFSKAKLGIFIHWGIYAVNGIDESWSFYNGYISHEDYMKQLEGFTAANYKAEKWVKLIKESGAKYAVITAKHHDGVALWDSKYSDLNVVKKTPAAKDLLEPFVKSLKKEGLKTGLYFSLLDWSNDNYPNFTKTEKRYENDSLRWYRFVKFNFLQLDELLHNYNPDLMWFDGDWEQSAEKWNAKGIRQMLLEKNPEIIINSRLQGYGDYATPEQGLPITKPTNKYWELCMTMNDSWGYQPNDKNYKSPFEVIRIFCDVLSMGGNLLLDIGPKADGNIAPEQQLILKELGKWTKKHQQAIYNSKAGINRQMYAGPSTLSDDENTLYLFVDSRPNGPLMLKGIDRKIKNIYVVGNGSRLQYHINMKPWWSHEPGICFIDLPEKNCDKYITVVAVEMTAD